MKKTTLSIFIALIFILSFSSTVVFAQGEESWDDTTVMSVFADLENVFPGLFDEEGNTSSYSLGGISFGGSESADSGNYESKAYVDPATSGTADGEFSACGDGRVYFDATVYRYGDGTTNPAGMTEYVGSKYNAYIRSLTADLTINGITYTGLSITNNNCSYNSSTCQKLNFNSNGEARLRGYIQSPVVIPDGAVVSFILNIGYSPYMTVLWDVSSYTATIPSGAVTQKDTMCQASIQPKQMNTNIDNPVGQFEECGGKAKFMVTVANLGSTDKYNYVIPGEVVVGDEIVLGTDQYVNTNTATYKNYTCKYTRFNSATGAPVTNYCKPGETIMMGAQELIRFEVTIDELSGNSMSALDTATIGFSWRLGGMNNLILGNLNARWNCGTTCNCTAKIRPMDPIKPFINFCNKTDSAISASGAYNVYENAVAGIYQKCGTNAKVIIRLKNFGVVPGVVDLNAPVAINGGTPMSFRWVLSNQPIMGLTKYTLEPDEELILIGVAKVTSIPSQMNSDAPINGAVNFTNLGLYLSGSIISDQNNTACYPAP